MSSARRIALIALATVSSARCRRNEAAEVFQVEPRDVQALFDGELPRRFEEERLPGPTARRARGSLCGRPSGWPVHWASDGRQFIGSSPRRRGRQSAVTTDEESPLITRRPMIFLRSPRVGSVALRSECCGGKFQVGGGLVDTLGDGVTGGRGWGWNFTGTFLVWSRRRNLGCRAPPPGGAAVVNAMTGRAVGYVVVPGDLVVRHDG